MGQSKLPKGQFKSERKMSSFFVIGKILWKNLHTENKGKILSQLFSEMQVHHEENFCNFLKQRKRQVWLLTH